MAKEDDDDVASVNSDRSALSFSSEISINPYTKYTQPIQVLPAVLIAETADVVVYCVSVYTWFSGIPLTSVN